MLIHWIWLATRPNMRDRDRITILSHFQDPENVYFADARTLSTVEGITAEIHSALLDKDLLSAEAVMNACTQNKIHLLTIQDAAYPNRLRNIADPPLVLYYKGSIPDLDGAPVIAVVGTRKASAYGLGIAKRMGYQLGSCGGIVVSGMAYGIDGMAMRGALTAGQAVVGVLGCGVDVVYPQSNSGLFRDVERNGCLLSEFPPGTPPYKWNFPKRNRIISGLACGVLVVEAPVASGALITARQAADQGRDVFVVPGNIDVPTCAGSNALLRDGALAVSSGWEVLSEYQQLYPGKIHQDALGSRIAAYGDEVITAAEENRASEAKVAQKTDVPQNKGLFARKKDKKTIDNQAVPPYSDQSSETSPDEQAVIALLKGGERLVDDVIAEAELPPGKVLAVLTMLEIKGVVESRPGRRVALK